MSFILVLCLLLPEILFQLIDLGLDLNRLLCLFLLLKSNLVLHVFAYISDPPRLLFAVSPGLVSLLFHLFKQRTAPIHLSIHGLNNLLSLLDCILLHLQLVLLVLEPLLDLHALLLLDLKSVQQVSLKHLQLGPGVFLLQELPVHDIALEGEVLLLLVCLIVEVSDVVIAGTHLVRHLDYQVVQFSLRHVQLLIGGVQGGELPVQAQDLLFTVS